ncbi:MAG: ThiF family adenylyltransferase [Deltaproteobacteria bacterium]|nr:ThiF family adenylyltransferase [Deltaproteobacteria bacterium]
METHRDDVLDEVCGAGFLTRPRRLPADALSEPWAKTRAIQAAIEGSVGVAGTDVGLRVGLGRRFPFELPHVFLAHPSAHPFLPHIDEHGWVCYQATEGLVLRTSAPVHIVEDALAMAVRTLDDGLAGRNWLDVYDELEAYWRQYGIDGLVRCYVEPDAAYRAIAVGFERREFRYVADTVDDVVAFEGPTQKLAAPRRGVYVPLTRSVLSERIDPRSFADAAFTRAYVRRHVEAAMLARLDRCGLGDAPWPFVVLGVPRPTNGRSLVGLHYEHVQGGHPLGAGTTTHPVRLVPFDRRDPRNLRARGGAVTKFGNTRIAVIGCGSVGGHVALAIAAAGVGNITLVDPDKLKTENVFRHVLGKSALGKYKVDGVKAELEQKFPYLNVRVLREHADEAIEHRTLDPGKFDLAIVTIGDITTSRRLNRQLQQHGTATVFTWLEPLGIGGHALLTHVTDGPGCYECLFRDPDGEEVLSNAADFAAAGQTFARDLTGCASVHTPYGALDAIRTAENATRLAVGALLDTYADHPLRSWKGDPAEFLARGFKLSPRFALEESRLRETATVFHNPRCPICALHA